MKPKNDTKKPALVVTIELKLWRTPDGTGDGAVRFKFEGEPELVTMLLTSAANDALELVSCQLRDAVLEHIDAIAPMSPVISRQIGRA